MEILKLLSKEGLVVKSGKVSTVVGRQPTTYEINNHILYAMGIDIDFPEAHLAISNLSGEMIFSSSCVIPTSLSAEAIQDRICLMVEEAIHDSEINRKEIIGLGIGLPAIVDIQRNLALRISKIPSWHNIDLASYIQTNCGIYTFIRNDAHLLGLIERKYWNLKEKSFLYITHRSGVGSSIFINGELYDGGFGNSGYIGHSCIDIHGPKCECGNSGCLELYCSRRAIVTNYNTEAKKNSLPIYSDAEQIFDSCQKGNELAKKVLEEAGRVLGLGIANVLLLYDINHVVLGCVKSKDTPFFSTMLHTINEQMHSFSETSSVSIELGVSDDLNSGMAGCYFILSQFFQAPSVQLSSIPST